MHSSEKKQGRHFVNLNDYNEEEILLLIKTALAYKNQSVFPLHTGIYAVNCFFEESTRTHKSFEMAERKLGINVLDFQPSMSSVKKGESLYDTVLTFQALGVDLVVIRHNEVGYYEELIKSETIHCSIINGGDGAGQHPSQSLLDLMTIYEEFGTFKGLKVAISGDILHSRVARSNMQILKMLGAQLFFTGPEEWIGTECLAYGEFKPIDDLVGQVDVMMLLRVQRERHAEQTKNKLDESYLSQFGLTAQREAEMREKAIIMHPAPVNRGIEIADELVECSRSRIVRQMENGVYARMAIIDSVLNKKTGDEMCVDSY